MTSFSYATNNTMLVGLISDTHIPDHVKELPKQLEDVFRGVDLILHAGDIYAISVLDELERIAPVLAAEGDDDFHPTVGDRRVKRRQVLTMEGVTIWLTHLRPRSWPPVSDESSQHEKLPDVIVFGHVHEARLENHKAPLLVCPGSATFPNYRNELGTVGLLTIKSGKADVRIIQLQ